jgi:hypothetical protein
LELESGGIDHIEDGQEEVVGVREEEGLFLFCYIL